MRTWVCRGRCSGCACGRHAWSCGRRRTMTCPPSWKLRGRESTIRRPCRSRSPGPTSVATPSTAGSSSTGGARGRHGRPTPGACRSRVFLDGRPIGVQDLRATNLLTERAIDTGSWLGLAWHGRGYGTEMRAAVLAFAFDHLGAVTARSAAIEGSDASRRVSMKLGYRPDGFGEIAPRGTPVREERFVLDRADFDREPWPLTVEGFDACRAMFGLEEQPLRSTRKQHRDQARDRERRDEHAEIRRRREQRQPHRERLDGRVAQDQQRPQVVLPGRDDREHRHDAQDRLRHRQDDRPEQPERPRAVDLRRLEDLARQVVEEALHDDHVERARRRRAARCAQ